MYETKARLSAMRWWNQLSTDARQFITDEHYNGRIHTTLTGREIEEMHSKPSLGVIKNSNTGQKVNFHFVSDEMIAYQVPEEDKVFEIEYSRLALVL